MNFNQELKKIRIEHLQQNMLDSIKELRFLDKAIIVFSGTAWAFLLRYTEDILSVSPQVIQCVILLTPFIVSLLLSVKAHYLYERYKIQKENYEKHIKVTNIETSYSGNIINNIKWFVVAINFILFLVILVKL
jgi:superoxide dismutase